MGLGNLSSLPLKHGADQKKIEKLMFVIMGASPGLRISCTDARFSHRKEIAGWCLVWEKRLKRSCINPCDKKMISPSTLSPQSMFAIKEETTLKEVFKITANLNKVDTQNTLHDLLSEIFSSISPDSYYIFNICMKHMNELCLRNVQ